MQEDADQRHRAKRGPGILLLDDPTRLRNVTLGNSNNDDVENREKCGNTEDDPAERSGEEHDSGFRGLLENHGKNSPQFSP